MGAFKQNESEVRKTGNWNDPLGINQKIIDGALAAQKAITPGSTGGSWSSNSNSNSSSGSGSSAGTGNFGNEESAKNLGAIVGYNAQTLTNQFNNNNAMYDIADKMNERLRNNQIRQARLDSSDSWWQQQKKLQAVNSQLSNELGVNGGYSSNWQSLNDLTRQAADDTDVQTLQTLRQNINDANNDHFSSLASNINSRNQAALETESALRQANADYAAQLNSLGNAASNNTNAKNLGDEYKDIYDTEGHTLNIPDWLDKGDWFNQHLRQAASPTNAGNLRDGNDEAKINETNPTKKTSAHTAANSSYWDKVTSEYAGRR